MTSSNSNQNSGRTTGKITDTSPHILVVDDDTRIRDLLSRYLMENQYRVTTAKDAADARAKLRGMAFDLLVLDVMMPGENGLDFAQDLRRKSDIPILMLTARGEAENRIAGLERGVDDYLAKPFEPRELLLRIATIIRRSQPTWNDMDDVVLGPCLFNAHRGDLVRDGEPVRLTSAEIAILRLLTSYPGKAFTRAELSEGTGTGLERSIDVQITRLRKKVEANPRIPRYLQTVRGVGYMLVPD